MSVRTIEVAPDVSGPGLDRCLNGAAAALADGRLVAFPTETVYGLGADAMSATAVEGIFAAKGRPADNPLIVHLPDPAWLDRVAVTTPLAARLAEAHWPGPMTLVLQARPEVPTITVAGLGTVAVRVPDSAIARRLIELAGTPVAAPSANRSGRPSPTTAQHVLADLADHLAWVVDGGPCDLGIESTVVDARGTVPVVLREGMVTREMLGVTGEEAGETERSPGTRHAHYQPRAEVRIAPPGEGMALAGALASGGRRVGAVVGHRGSVPSGVTVLATVEDGEGLAKRLYAALREADERGLDVVVVEAVSEAGVGRAVMDRLRRAAG